MGFAGGHISGGHYRRAVSLAVMIRGKLTIGERSVGIPAGVSSVSALALHLDQGGETAAPAATSRC
jgi:hypothetical protein